MMSEHELIFKNVSLPLKDRQHAFLQDTIEHYTSLNRAIGLDGVCSYQLTDNSEGCAIGRWCAKEGIDMDVWFGGVSRVFKDLPEWMQSLGLTFLGNIQLLHDNYNGIQKVAYWNETGLTDEGKQRVEEIKAIDYKVIIN